MNIKINFSFCVIVDYKNHYIWNENFMTDIMQNSILSLVQQIHAAAGLQPNSAGNPVAGSDYSLTESITDAEVASTFENVMGLKYSQFSSADEMSDDEINTVIAALDETFSAYDYSVEVPDRVPLALKYELYRDLFSGEHVLTPGYTCHFDFCSGYCPGCKVADFCESRITDGWE